jgi:hypothetical protein
MQPRLSSRAASAKTGRAAGSWCQQRRMSARYAGSPANCTDKHTRALKRDVPLSTSSQLRSPTQATCVPPAGTARDCQPTTPTPIHNAPIQTIPTWGVSTPGRSCKGGTSSRPPAATVAASCRGRGRSRGSTITSPGTAELPPCMQCGSAKSVHTYVPLQQQAGASAYHKHCNAVMNPPARGSWAPRAAPR